MADYFAHFSCLIDVGTPDKAAHAFALFQELRAADQDADDPDVAGFDLVHQDAREGIPRCIRTRLSDIPRAKAWPNISAGLDRVA